MQNIRDQIDLDFKEAFKSKEKEKSEVLKMLRSSIKNAEIDSGSDSVSDELVLEILQKEVKKRKESVDAYTDAGNKEKADAEQREIEVISKYMPEQLSDEEIGSIVKEKADELSIDSMAGMGKLMGILMSELKGKADGKKVKDIVAKVLS